jgi:hypothetical protein
MDKIQNEEKSTYQNDDYCKIANEYETIYNYDFIEEVEAWRFDDLNREQSDMILKNYKEAFKTGTFLIRKSEKDPSYLTLCIL